MRDLGVNFHLFSPDCHHFPKFAPLRSPVGLTAMHTQHAGGAVAGKKQQHLPICAGLSATCVSHHGDMDRLYCVSMAAENTAAWLAEQTHLQLLLFGLPVPPDLNATLPLAGTSGGVSCICLNLPPYQCLLRQEP